MMTFNPIPHMITTPDPLVVNDSTSPSWISAKATPAPTRPRHVGPNQDEADLPSDAIEVVEINSASDLQKLTQEWLRLVELNREPNVFLEPHVLLPALTHLANHDVKVLVAMASRRVRPEAPRVMCGLLPIAPASGIEGRLGKGVVNWLHDQSYLGHPLIREDVRQATFKAFIDHLSQNGARYLHLKTVPGDGPFAHLLAEFLQTTGSPFFVRDLHQRAMYRPSTSAADFMARWSRSKRQSLGRLTRRLEEIGTLQTRLVSTRNEAERWLNQFLLAERESWKGAAGTALANSERSAKFVHEMVLGAFDAGGAMLVSLELDNEPIAYKLNLLSGDGGFAFKICFDARVSKYSPGCLLEKANIEMLAEQPSIRWMDSCAQPNHPMIDSLWPERRLIQSVTIGTGARGSSFIAAALPLARWIQHCFKHRQHAESQQ